MALANEQYYRAGHINSIFSILDWPHTNYETEVRPWICIPGKIFVATPLIPWLVVFRQPLWKMMELLVTWGYEIPNWMEIHVPNNIYIYYLHITWEIPMIPRPTGDPLATCTVHQVLVESLKEWSDPGTCGRSRFFRGRSLKSCIWGFKHCPLARFKKKHAISINWDIIDYKWDSMCI